MRDLIGRDADVEAVHQIGDLCVGEAALTQETDFFAEHGERLLDAEAFFVGACCLTKFPCGDGDLFRGEADWFGQEDLRTRRRARM